MKKILILPLDERPCNYRFNQMLAEETNYEIVLPPIDILGQKKQKGNTELIAKWLLENIKNVDAAIISVDMLCYGGIVPSRLHYDSIPTILKRLDILKQLKIINSKVKIYAHHLIMRNPAYSSSEEEPDYYETEGRDIHLYGVIKHKISLNQASNFDLEQLNLIEKRIDKAALKDYLDRREVNLTINKAFIQLGSEDYYDFGIVPQDDSSFYGLTALDQIIIRKAIVENNMEMKIYMYPGADEITNVLMTRAINEIEGKSPKIYPYFSSKKAPNMIPLYEDRQLSESLKYQIITTNAVILDNDIDADIILMINAPSSEMMEAINYDKPNPNYDVNRNLIEFILKMKYYLSIGKKVAVADIAYANGGDPYLIKIMKQEKLLYRVCGYAGWNTSANSLGTVIPQAILNMHYPNRKSNERFLALRYIEDVGYCTFARPLVRKTLKEPYHNFLIDGKRGSVVEQIKKELESFIKTYLSLEEKIPVIKDIYSPWNRMFEIGLEVDLVDNQAFDR